MPKKKQKFIDKKNGVSFRLVHRSQRDPLAADADASQHVLQPLDGSTSTVDPAERRKTLVKYGVFYEDDYDYMQHLRSVEEYYDVHLSEPLRQPSEVEVDDDDPEGIHLFRKTPQGFVPVVHPPPSSTAAAAKKSTSVHAAAAPAASPEENVVRVGDGEMRLPASAFASTHETETGLVHKGVGSSNLSGPLIGWDPDIVAALDEDFDVEDPDNLLDDDFILRANQSDEFDSDDDDDDDDWSDEESGDEGSDDDEVMERVTSRLDGTHLTTTTMASAGNLTSGEEVGHFKSQIEAMKRAMAMEAMKRFDDGDVDDDVLGFDDLEDTKSRFTEYSMTSSVIRRNDQLTLLDDRFERLYEQYDDDQIGGLDGEDIGGGGGTGKRKVTPPPTTTTTTESFNHHRINGGAFQDILVEFEKQNAKLTADQALEKLGVDNGLAEAKKRDVAAENDNNDDDDDDDEDDEQLVKLTVWEKTEKKNDWDCESILSTYSNLYNHPKTIAEPSKKNKNNNSINDNDVDDSASKRRIKLSNKSGLPLGALPVAAGPTHRQLESMDYDGLTRLRTAPTLRGDAETPEERRTRKRAVKEERRERRMEKKANVSAFKDEEKKQKKNLADLQTNIQGIKIH